MGVTIKSCVCCGSSDLDANPALWMPFVSDRALGIPPLRITPDLGLRSIPVGTSYALCKSLHCRRCGHLFTNYRFDEEEMQRLYIDYRGEAYTDLRESYEPGYTYQNNALEQGHHYTKVVEEFLVDLIGGKSISILDWGGDTGKNTPFARVAEVLHLYEPSGIQPEIDGARNVSQPEDFQPSYALLVLSNVLEHLPFPGQTLDVLTSYMDQESILYIEVPFEGLQQAADAGNACRAKPIEKKWHWHEHINFFSRKSLNLLIEASGFHIIKSASTTVSRGSSNVSSSMILQVACRKA